MRCRYEFFLVSPNNNYSDDYEDDWDDTYIGVDASGKDDRVCITFSQKSKATGEITVVNGLEYTSDVNEPSYFKGTGVGLHISSVYGIPFVPTQSSRIYGESAIKTMYDKAKNIQCIQFLKPEPYLKVKPRTTGYPFMSGTIMANLVDEAPYVKRPCINIIKKERIIKFKNTSWNNLGASTDILSALNLEANVFAELPKTSWDFSGIGVFLDKKPCLNFR